MWIDEGGEGFLGNNMGSGAEEELSKERYTQGAGASSRTPIIGCGEQQTSHSPSMPLPYLGCSFSSPLCISLTPPLSPSLYLAQILWKHPARGALKSERSSKESQVCRGDMMGPEVGLRGEGQTLECVTKG